MSLNYKNDILNEEKIQFNEEEAAVVDIYNTIGYKGNYSLSQLEALDE